VQILVLILTIFLGYTHTIEACARSLTAAASIYRSPQEEWLRNNLFFGPEVTFTNKILDDIRYIHRKGKVRIPLSLEREAFIAELIETNRNDVNFFNRELAAELHRLIVTALGATKVRFQTYGTFSFRKSSHSEFKTAPVNLGQYGGFFVLGFDDGRQATLNLEDGHVELNLPPVTLARLESTWQKPLSKIFASGFTGSPYWRAGGGGGHTHLGFRSEGENLFLSDPKLLASLILVPVLYPGWVYFLKEASDFNVDSPAAHPFDLQVDSKRLYQLRLQALSEELQYLRKLLTSKESQLWPSHLYTLSRHESYISTKNFWNKKNPTLEFRFPRAFNSFADLEAHLHFLFRLVLQYHGRPLAPPSYNELRARLKTGFNQVSENMRDDWARLMSEVGLSRQHRRQLMNFGGEPSAFIKSVKGGEDIRLRAEYRLNPLKSNPREFYQFSFDTTKIQNSEKWPFIFVNGRRYKLFSYGKRKYFILSFDIEAHTHKLISFLDESGKIVRSMVLEGEYDSEEEDRRFRWRAPSEEILRDRQFLNLLPSRLLKMGSLNTNEFESQIKSIFGDSETTRDILFIANLAKPPEIDFPWPETFNKFLEANPGQKIRVIIYGKNEPKEKAVLGKIIYLYKPVLIRATMQTQPEYPANLEIEVIETKD